MHQLSSNTPFHTDNALIHSPQDIRPILFRSNNRIPTATRQQSSTSTCRHTTYLAKDELCNSSLLSSFWPPSCGTAFKLVSSLNAYLSGGAICLPCQISRYLLFLHGLEELHKFVHDTIKMSQQLRHFFLQFLLQPQESCSTGSAATQVISHAGSPQFCIGAPAPAEQLLEDDPT